VGGRIPCTEIKEGSLDESSLLEVGEGKLDEEVTGCVMGCEGTGLSAGGGKYENSCETTGSIGHCGC